MNICGTLLLAPSSQIVACDAAAAQLFRCSASELIDKPICEVIPDLPLRSHAPSENIRFADHFGNLAYWRTYTGRKPNGVDIAIDIMLSRCGFRPRAALWILVRHSPALPVSSPDRASHRRTTAVSTAAATTLHVAVPELHA